MRKVNLAFLCFAAFGLALLLSLGVAAFSGSSAGGAVTGSQLLSGSGGGVAYSGFRTSPYIGPSYPINADVPYSLTVDISKAPALMRREILHGKVVEPYCASRLPNDGGVLGVGPKLGSTNGTPWGRAVRRTFTLAVFGQDVWNNFMANYLKTRPVGEVYCELDVVHGLNGSLPVAIAAMH
jgi:hypothetical protein